MTDMTDIGVRKTHDSLENFQEEEEFTRENESKKG